MEEYSIKNINELLEIVETQSKNVTVLYRGMKSADFQLIPSIGRLDFIRGSLEKNEQRIFKLFKESSITLLDYHPKNEWEWLAIAQHYWLPTRLLDWSYNPLVAAYFAVEEFHDGDSVIYLTKSTDSVNVNKENPFSIGKVKKYTPPIISERINTQSGCFTVHPNPKDAYESDDMTKILIPNKYRADIKHMLFKLGFRKRMIYPGLEGIAKDLVWLKSKIY